MRHAWVTGVAVLLASAATARGLVVIDGGYHPVFRQSGLSIPIRINSDAPVNIDGLDLQIQIGDGGANVGGATNLPITNVQFGVNDGASLPTIWGANHDAPAVDTLLGEIAFASVSTNTGTVPVTNVPQVLAVLTVDASNAFPGVYPIILRGGPFAMNSQVYGPPGQASEDTLPSIVLEGTIIFIPEPATGMLLLALAPFLRRRVYAGS